MDDKHLAVANPTFGDRKPKRSLRGALLWRVLLLVGSFALAKGLLGALTNKHASPRHELRVAPSDPEAVWDDIPPSTVDSLSWVSCYSGKECARLMVPLDYAKPDGPQAGVAMVKIPSKYGPGDEKYRGPILFNPGGPGGSGVGFIALEIGDSFQRLIGEEFDIIGFDPRGVGRTTPQVVFFPDEAEAAAWRIRVEGDPGLNTSADALPRLWARAQVQSAIAGRASSHASPYVGTALVARDMLSIVRAHGTDKLQYWGVSYGTILGATFAAMFPDNVGRLIIDGVVDADDYYAGTWANNLQDTDKALGMIIDACVSAGPECPLYESTSDKVHARLNAIFTNLKKQPLPVYNGTTGKEYGIIDYKLARAALFALVYFPYGVTAMTPIYTSIIILHALAQLEKGDGLELGRILGMVPVQAPFSCNCPGEPPAPRPIPLANLDATIAIACGDAAASRGDDTVPILEEYYGQLSKISEFADMWPIRISCSGWRTRPVERFAGPFVANTSFPLLIIGNTADPVTPLAHAWKMSHGFNNSVVLQQDSAGHCTIAATSLCSAKAIRDYFREGKLPQNGTICSVDSSIFPSNALTEKLQTLEGEDREVMGAWMDISAAHKIPMLGRVW
ncbi:alpha/beta hydrolase [Phanerochaete sordida]|uniref:Alpha/beta hydrolase n=1 Tax=Phanerochaete sordida TaxID=48140 RepID=A0A9P3GK50_9APHY|nr:alpha/beta hydrolase [Phanerochaete sordida]